MYMIIENPYQSLALIAVTSVSYLTILSLGNFRNFGETVFVSQFGKCKLKKLMKVLFIMFCYLLAGFRP